MADRISAPKVLAMKVQRQAVVCITAYDVMTAAIADAAGADVILVGDSVGNVVLGYENTIPVTLAEMIHHTRAASRGTSRALLVADLPFGSYQASVEQAVNSSVDLIKAGAQAVKLEGVHTEAIRAIVRAGIPVMGHLGMTPQSVHAFGGFKVQGNGEAAERLISEAHELEQAGVFAMVLELIPGGVAQTITRSVGVPTIGIGAGPKCDGQIQVFHDVTGLSTAKLKHAKRYVEGLEILRSGVRAYVQEVRENRFPTDEHSF